MGDFVNVSINEVKQAAVAIARESFYAYCQLRLPKIYRPERKHLKKLCDILQRFSEDKLLNEDGLGIKNVIINMPPRHGKTLTVELLCEWGLGKKPETAIMVACYNEELSGRFGKAVRNGISERSPDPTKLCYDDFFPGVKVKAGDASFFLWALEGRHFSFLASSPGGTMTGFGTNLLVIDDIIKNSQESMNDRMMENHWDWYNNTVRSRVEAGGKQIVIQTRWSTKDLSGRLLDSEPGKWHLISMPAYDEATGLMLCDDMFSRDDFEERERILDPVVFKGNYQQQPYDSIDRLYTFQTYTRTEIPNDGVVQCYIDTADGGGDYLAAVFFRAVGMKLFIVDIVFTAESMEKSEPLTAETAIRHGCTRMYIESNSGGGGFGRAVQRIMAESGYTGCQFEMFHQMENKVSRILSNATSVSNSILMPDDWAYRWPAAYRELTSMGRSGKWLHEDLGDAITGALEKGLGAGLNPKVYPDYSRNLISRITVEPGETILFAQSLNGAYPHGVACVRRNNEIHVIKTFLDESLEAVAQGIRDAFIGHDIYWYPYSDGVELSASTIKLMQSHGIKTRIGNIFPSDLEMISVPNNLMRRGRLLFVENCQSVTSALEVRRFDDRGKPETLRGSRPIYLTCDCISYLIWRMIGQYPQIGA